MIVTNDLTSLKLLLYISSLIFSKKLGYLYPIYMYVRYVKIFLLKRQYSVVQVPSELIARITGNLTFSDEVVLVSNHLYAVLTTKFVYFRTCERIIQTYPFKQLVNKILISNVAYTNFKFGTSTLGDVPENVLQFAKDVNVALVNGPTKIGNDTLDEVLKIYFKTPRLLYKGDVFSISLKTYVPHLVCTNLHLLNIDRLCFKCLKIDKSGSFCMNGETSLTLGANTQSYIPLCEHKVMWNDSNVNYVKNLVPVCPFGFEKRLESIERAVKPFLKKRKLFLNPSFLLQAPKGSGKSVLVEALAFKLGLHLYDVECSDIQGAVSTHGEVKLRAIFLKAKLCTPCVLSINNFENFGKDAEGHSDPRLMQTFRLELDSLFQNNNYPLILFCKSNAKELAPELGVNFLETFTLDAPTKEDRYDLLKWLLISKGISYEANLNEIADKCHGFLLSDLDTLIYHAKKNNYLKLHRSEAVLKDDDFSKALDAMQLSYSKSVGRPEVPKVLWSDVGGLEDLKREIIRTINTPLQHSKHLGAFGMKRSGILLYGPPGTGKTLIAKAIATEFNLCFLSVKGPELLNMYVGQSEQNVREVFEKAAQASPCIVFFDELDSLAPNRGLSGDSGGVMDRVVSQLLSEMDGIDQSAEIFVIGATNRPDLIDPALLRPGRFDKLLYVGAAKDEDSKTGILKALTRKFNLADDVDFKMIVSQCGDGVTGADMYSLCSNAWLQAVRRTVELFKTDGITSELNARSVVVTLSDFLTAASNLTPSVSNEDMRYFEKLQKQLSSVP